MKDKDQIKHLKLKTRGKGGNAGRKKQNLQNL